jgi:hypothetical protein
LRRQPVCLRSHTLTGGGFLQQVIFGYTGLRLGERGLEPGFPPLLPSTSRDWFCETFTPAARVTT